MGFQFSSVSLYEALRKYAAAISYTKGKRLGSRYAGSTPTHTFIDDIASGNLEIQSVADDNQVHATLASWNDLTVYNSGFYIDVFKGFGFFPIIGQLQLGLNAKVEGYKLNDDFPNRRFFLSFVTAGNTSPYEDSDRTIHIPFYSKDIMTIDKLWSSEFSPYKQQFLVIILGQWGDPYRHVVITTGAQVVTFKHPVEEGSILCPVVESGNALVETNVTATLIFNGDELLIAQGARQALDSGDDCYISLVPGAWYLFQLTPHPIASPPPFFPHIESDGLSFGLSESEGAPDWIANISIGEVISPDTILTIL